MKKNTKVLILVLCICIAFFILVYVSLVSFVDTLNAMNTHARILMCEKTLKAIWSALEQYMGDFNEDLPASLSELEPYMKETWYKCPGDREEDEISHSRDYCYHILSSKEPAPICWDSKPHRKRWRLLPDTYTWNVLYTDGHVERLNKRDFLSLMRSIGISDPNYP